MLPFLKWRKGIKDAQPEKWEGPIVTWTYTLPLCPAAPTLPADDHVERTQGLYHQTWRSRCVFVMHTCTRSFFGIETREGNVPNMSWQPVQMLRGTAGESAQDVSPHINHLKRPTQPGRNTDHPSQSAHLAQSGNVSSLLCEHKAVTARDSACKWHSAGVIVVLKDLVDSYRGLVFNIKLVWLVVRK